MRDDTRLSPSALVPSGCDVGARRRGARDINFLAAMKELSALVNLASGRLLRQSMILLRQRMLRRTRAELESERANLVERSFALEPAGQPAGVAKMSCSPTVSNIASNSIRLR